MIFYMVSIMTNSISGLFKFYCPDKIVSYRFFLYFAVCFKQVELIKE